MYVNMNRMNRVRRRKKHKHKTTSKGYALFNMFSKSAYLYLKADQI